MPLVNRFSGISNANNIAEAPRSEGVGGVRRSGSALGASAYVCAVGTSGGGSAHLCVWYSWQSSMESPNLEFEYGDTDTLTAELSGTSDGPTRGTSRGVC